MQNLLLGWGEIFDFLRVDYSVTDKRVGESWREWTERKTSVLMRRGLPVFFMPILDDKPRLYVPDAMAWLRTYHEANTAKAFVALRERKEVEAMREAEAQAEAPSEENAVSQ
jgi:hypothetical protein